MSYFQVDGEKIEVVYNGIEDEFRAESPAETPDASYEREIFEAKVGAALRAGHRHGAHVVAGVVGRRGRRGGRQ